MSAFGTNYNSTILENPPWLDTGDNAWQLTAASLVGLQSIPGLTVLYAGLVKRKWVINSMFMTFYAFAMVLLCWSIWAYNVGFGQYMLPFAGKPGPILTIGELIRQSDLPSTASPGPLSTQDFPKATMAYFQFVFAAITLVLIAGGYLGRMNFTAWMVFVPLWLTFSYCVGAYSLWGGGYLFKLGVIDYSGGYVIHLSSGTAAFTGAYWIGPRLKQDRQNFQPSNIPLMMVGAGIIWIGWNGFNGGVSLHSLQCTARQGLTYHLHRTPTLPPPTPASPSSTPTSAPPPPSSPGPAWTSSSTRSPPSSAPSTA